MAKKFQRGYPQDNILFTDDSTALLTQNRQEVVRYEVLDTAALKKQALLHRQRR